LAYSKPRLAVPMPLAYRLHLEKALKVLLIFQEGVTFDQNLHGSNHVPNWAIPCSHSATLMRCIPGGVDG